MINPGRRRRAWLLLGLLAVTAGCNRQDPERLARVGQRAAAKAEALTGGSNGRLAVGWRALCTDLDRMALDSRISARLRWDQALEGAQVEVFTNGDLVELRGTVRDHTQQARAVELARSTVGAREVTDSLVIPGRTP